MVAMANSEITLPIQDCSLLNLLTRLPPQWRGQEYPEVERKLQHDFSKKAARVLMNMPESDPRAHEYVIWLLEDCGIPDEAEERRRIRQQTIPV